LYLQVALEAADDGLLCRGLGLLFRGHDLTIDGCVVIGFALLFKQVAFFSDSLSRITIAEVEERQSRFEVYCL